MKLRETKSLWKFFVIFFFIIFLIINWAKISLFFNYRVIWHNISDIFRKENIKNPEETGLQEKINKENSIEIPKIMVLAPLVSAEEGDNNQDFKESLDKGVLLYPESILPGQKGLVIILGHSAPTGWPEINYDNVFSNLDQLESGDEVLIYFDNKEYSYSVFDKRIFLPKDEESVFSEFDKSKPYLCLITCWPPGKDYKRLAVFSELE